MPDPAQDRREPRVGIRPERGVLGVHVRAVDRRRQFVATGAHEHALVVGADVMSSIIDYQDRATCVIFGDGAGAAVISAATRADDGRIIDFEHEIDGGGALGAVHAGGRQPAAALARDRRSADALREAGRADRVQVRGAQDRGDRAPHPRSQRPEAVRPEPVRVASGEPADHSVAPPRSSGSTRASSSSTSSASATRPRRRFRSR